MLLNAIVSTAIIAAAEVPKVSPSENDLPGGNIAQQFLNGIGFYALVFTVIGLILSAGMWAVGAFSNNYTQSVNGKKGFLICAGAALAIGGAQILVQWFYDRGKAINDNTTNK